MVVYTFSLGVAVPVLHVMLSPNALVTRSHTSVAMTIARRLCEFSPVEQWIEQVLNRFSGIESGLTCQCCCGSRACPALHPCIIHEGSCSHGLFCSKDKRFHIMNHIAPILLLLNSMTSCTTLCFSRRVCVCVWRNVIVRSERSCCWRCESGDLGWDGMDCVEGSEI